MSDEDAFLAALAENPADDVRRLVYADWLEERGETEKATYLRLVCRAVEALGTPAEGTVVDQLFTTSEALPWEWRDAAAGRFSLVLRGYEPHHKIEIIKLLRETFGWSLADAKEQAETLPNRLLHLSPLEDVYWTRAKLLQVGDYQLSIETVDWRGPKRSAPYATNRLHNIFVVFDFSDGTGDRPATDIDTAIGSINQFLQRQGPPGYVPNNEWDSIDGYFSRLWSNVSLPQAVRRMPSIRADGQRTAKGHEMHFTLYLSPSIDPR